MFFNNSEHLLIHGQTILDANFSKDAIQERFIQAVKSTGISDYKLAQELGATPSSVGNWLKRGTQPPLNALGYLDSVHNISSEWILTGVGDMTKPIDHSDYVVKDYLEKSLHAAKLEVDRLRGELKDARAAGVSTGYELMLGGEKFLTPAETDMVNLEKMALNCALRVIRNASENAPAGKVMPPKKAAEITVRAYKICLEGQMAGMSQKDIVERLDRIA